MNICLFAIVTLWYFVSPYCPLMTWGEIEHNPADPQRQGPGHEPRLTFARCCSCSVHMLYPLAIH